MMEWQEKAARESGSVRKAAKKWNVSAGYIQHLRAKHGLDKADDVAREEYIYFIQVVPDGPIKIGLAVKPEERLEHLQIGCPYELVLRLAIRGGRATEARLHERFAAHRIRGEWFEPVPALVALVDGEVLPLAA